MAKFLQKCSLAIERTHDEQCEVSFKNAGVEGWGGVRKVKTRLKDLFCLGNLVAAGRIFVLSPPALEDWDKFDTTVVVASGAVQLEFLLPSSGQFLPQL